MSITGSGTYDDPITIATAESELSVCETVYIPLLKKYGRHEDDCTQCGKIGMNCNLKIFADSGITESDWNNGQAHIDIWTGSNSSGGGDAQIDCEDNLTSGGQYSIVRQPATDLEVDSMYSLLQDFIRLLKLTWE